MTPTITTRPGSPDRRTNQYITEISSRLSQRFRRVFSVEWNLQKEGPRHLATCRIHAQSGFYRVRVMADSFRSAIHKAEEAIARTKRRAVRLTGRQLRTRPEPSMHLTKSAGRWYPLLLSAVRHSPSPAPRW